MHLTDMEYAPTDAFHYPKVAGQVRRTDQLVWHIQALSPGQ